MIYRIIYTLCALLLCAINFIVGSQTGRVQFVGINCAGFLVAAIILSAYKLKDFLKPIYYIWTGVAAVAGTYAIIWGHSNYPYFGRWITAVLNVVVYGFIVIRVIYGLFVEKNVRPVKWITLGLWVVMIALMIISPNEALWPLWYGVMFLSMYLTDFGKERLSAMLDGIMNGLIIGFLLLQGFSFAFRPYDNFRYFGFTSNPNMTALFYIVVFAALSAKWCIAIHTGKKWYVRMIWAVLTCSIYGFVILTACKAALAAMVPLTLIFLIAVIIGADKKVQAFFKYGAVIVLLAVVCIPVTYLAVRYLPTIHLHPVFFEGEWHPTRILPGESRDSDKYVSFNEFLTGNFGRLLWFIDFEKDEEPVRDTESARIEKKAAKEEEKEVINEVYLFSYEEGSSLDPIKLRMAIHGYYLKHLNIFGHSSSEDGVPITMYYTIPHAHNWIIQMSFSFGIIVGVLFLYMVVQHIITIVRAAKAGDYKFVCLVGGIITEFLVFGFFEVDWAMGHIQFLLFFLLYYFAVSKEELFERQKKNGDESLR